jgi:hypothetical protein
LSQAYSTSSLWYAILDFGTNYCNLRNLLDGAGLADAPGKLVRARFSKFKIRVARFFLVQHTKMGKIDQIATKYTKRPENIRNGHKVFRYLPRKISLQDIPKFTQIWIFGLKIYHLATLLANPDRS